MHRLEKSNERATPYVGFLKVHNIEKGSCCMPYFSIVLKLGHKSIISKLMNTRRRLILYLNTIQKMLYFFIYNCIKKIRAQTLPSYVYYTKDLISFYDHRFVKFEGIEINLILYL